MYKDYCINFYRGLLILDKFGNNNKLITLNSVLDFISSLYLIHYYYYYYYYYYFHYYFYYYYYYYYYFNYYFKIKNLFNP